MRFVREDSQDEFYDRLNGLDQKLSQDVAEREKESVFGSADWRLCAEQGVQGLLMPAEYGGLGGDPAGYVRAMEGLGHACQDNGLLMSLGAQILAVQVPILKFGDEHQRNAYLPGLVSGRLIGANAMTEPGTGSDALGLRTTAVRDGDGYRLTGRKCYVTNAPVSDVFVVYATVDRGLGFTGVTAFLVERGDPGLTVRTGAEKMGLRTAPWGELELDGCRIPAGRRLGREKQGSAIFALTMSWERALLMSPWLGVMRREIDACVDHSRRRRQFGKHIGHFQSVSNRLVDMQVRWEAARLLIYRAAAELASPKPGVHPEIAKLYVGDAAVETFTNALQVYGALGYTTELRVERNLRDALGMAISSGTSDMQRVIIAGRMGLSFPARSGQAGVSE